MFSCYKTPEYNHVFQYEDVYEPSEDSFLLLDALEEESDFLLSLRPSVCLEVGSGSGVVITFLASVLGGNVHYVATDINPKACICSQETAERNKVTVDVINTNMVDGCRFSPSFKVDVLMFNPPYVVTPSCEIPDCGISAAWAGGSHGREVSDTSDIERERINVMDKLFPVVPNILSEKGVFYLLVVDDNKPDEIKDLMSSYGLVTKTVMRRRARNENLSVLRINRPSLQF